MSRHAEDPDGQPALQPQFEKPLDLVPELAIDSPSSVASVIRSLESQMTNCARDDWQPKVQAIQTAMSYLKGGISHDLDADLSVLAAPIAQCVADLRSALVRWGALYTAAGSQVLQAGFLSSAEVIVPSLFRQLSHGTGVISNSCRLALLEVARHVQHRRTARFFL
jgi:conjugal transfer/entry exclusion protein